MMDTYTAKAWSHSAILVTGCCLDLDPATSSKPKWLGTRSLNSMNTPASTFCTRLGGTGGMAEPGGIAEPGGGGTGEIDESRGDVVVALLRVGVSKLTWSRSKPAGRYQPIMPS